MKNLFLIGYMGAGKTLTGKALAKRLGWQFMDTDRFIENRYHKTINELFAEKGESFFREIERKTLLEVAQFENTVIATGGGAPCFFNNMEIMNNAGTTIYLKVSVNELAERLNSCKQDRPLVKDKSLEDLRSYIAGALDQRENWYSRAAIVYPAENITTKEDLEVMTENLVKRING
jgi:shikimate kinase